MNVTRLQTSTLSGILFVALFAISSLYLAQLPWITAAKLNTLVIAILLGIL